MSTLSPPSQTLHCLCRTLDPQLHSGPGLTSSSLVQWNRLRRVLRQLLRHLLPRILQQAHEPRPDAAPTVAPCKDAHGDPGEPRPSAPPDAVGVRFAGVLALPRKVVVADERNVRDVQTPPSNVGGHQDLDVARPKVA